MYTGSEAKKTKLLKQIATFECSCRKEFGTWLEKNKREIFGEFKAWLREQRIKKRAKNNIFMCS